MNETHRLLQEYVDEGSEAAFREIVTRYIDLVYSVALRRVSGDAHRAQDVVQTVFTDLARKAGSLPPNVMLGGWLHRHSCFVASTICRGEIRRAAREKEAIDLMKGNQESSWDDLAPVLDDAIQDLEEQDRSAITLRFFERRDLRTIGGLIGISEDAAQKRVSRALEKLRHLLTKRGVALSATALTANLEANSVSAAPTSWAAQVSSQALSTASAKLGLLATLALFFSGTAVKVASVAILAVVVGSALYFKKPKEASLPQSEPQVRIETTHQSAQGVLASAPTSENAQQSNAAGASTDTRNGIRLLVLSAETGQPIASGPVELRGWNGDKFFKGSFSSDSEGVCFVDFARDKATQVEITTRIPSYADTRLRWIPKQGETVPKEYTLRLARGIPIGGVVVNEQDQPVAGAKVGFNDHDNPASAGEIESHVFSWIEVEADNAGRWSIDRIGTEILNNIYGGASHPEYVGSESLDLNHDSGPLKDLRAGTHTFHLKRAVEVRGIVLDQDRNPVSGASVLAGPRGMSGSREAIAALDGTFELKGVKPGTNMLTAQASQFSPATVQFFAETNSPPVEIILGRGQILKMRVVNKSGEPITKANIWLDTMSHDGTGEFRSVQADYQGKTDADGRIYWDQAPAGKLRFTVSAKGYCRQDGLEFEADGSEHTVTLKPGLRIFGTVRDAESNNPIPRFKIMAGWPGRVGPEGKQEPHWSDIDRYTLTFAEGKFDYRFEEPVIYGTKEWNYIFKFSADNYSAFITRVVEGDEAEVQFEIQLKPSRAMRITLLQPNGEPAANTEVLFAGVQQQVFLSDHGFDRRGGDGGNVVTDSKGLFSWQPEDAIVAIYAAGPAGFASAKPAELENSSTLQMRAWGRIEGSYSKRGQPLVGVRMALDNMPRHVVRTEPWVHLNASPTTDAEGRFQFSTVPPMKFQLCYMWPSDRSFSYVPLLEVDVRPGETTTVNYAEDGVDVIARVHLPAGVIREKGDMLFAFVHTPTPMPPSEIMGNQEALQKWAQSPEVAPQLQNVKSWPMREMPDGTFKAETIPAGEYGVDFHLGRANNSSPQLFARRTITVTGEEPNSTLDLGDIALEAMPVSSIAQAAKPE